jgi:hypothetical protein
MRLEHSVGGIKEKEKEQEERSNEGCEKLK